MDPKSLHELTADTWVALSATDDAITVWDTRDPRHPVPEVSLPVGSGNTGELAVAPVSDGWLVGTDYASTPDDVSGSASGSGMASAMNLAEIRDGGRSIENYAQVQAQVGDFTLSSEGRSMATTLGTDGELDETGNASDLSIFSPQDIHDNQIGILYPLDADSLYTRLCSDTVVEHPSSSWRRYLPSTYYRSACS